MEIVTALWATSGGATYLVIVGNVADPSPHYRLVWIDESGAVKASAESMVYRSRSRGEFARAAAVQADGKVVVSGERVNQGITHMVVSRFLPSGSFDKTGFGSNGSVSIPVASGTSAGLATTQYLGGRVAVASCRNGYLYVHMLRKDGSSDPDFGWDGLAITGIGPEDCPQRLHMSTSPLGVVVAGQWSVQSGSEVVQMVLSPAGTPLISGRDPELAPLTDVAGYTATHAPRDSDSPVVDVSLPSGPSTIDQTGRRRPVGVRNDLGAHEYRDEEITEAAIGVVVDGDEELTTDPTDDNVCLRHSGVNSPVPRSELSPQGDRIPARDIGRAPAALRRHVDSGEPVPGSDAGDGRQP